MRTFTILLVCCGLAVGCMPTRPEPVVKSKETDKAAEEKVAAQLPLVLPESVNEYNASQKAQALLDEMNRDQKGAAKSLAEARK